MLKPIRTEKEYDDALARVYELMQTDIVERSAISDELEVLSLLIKEYELIHYPLSYPNPIEAIKFRMEQMNLSENELSELLGTRSRKSEILLFVFLTFITTVFNLVPMLLPFFAPSKIPIANHANFRW
ncbi:HTH-type transcriptional regulator/antitoxin HigA [Pedobacter sp. CAN_A7]